MSYDIYLKAEGEQVPTFEAFKIFFNTRPHYRIDKWGKQVWYENEDTGVYFTFDYYALPESVELGEAGPVFQADAAFNLNHCRPHYFIYEAQEEVRAFIQHFNWQVCDPQLQSEGTVFSMESFVEKWQQCNQMTCQSFKEAFSDETFYHCPTKKLEQVWLWNKNRQRLQEEMEKAGVFVPQISFLADAHGVKTYASWTDTIPIALPVVDVVLFTRVAHSSKKLLFVPVPDMALAIIGDLESLLAGFSYRSDPVPYYLLDYQEAPADLIATVSGLSVVKASAFTMLSPDKVLNSEYFNEPSLTLSRV